MKPVYTPSPDKFPCTTCGKTLKSLHSLRRHKREQHVKRDWSYICTFCPTTFDRRASVRRHIESHHPNEEQPPVIHIKQHKHDPLPSAKMTDLRQTLSDRQMRDAHFNIRPGNNTPELSAREPPTLILPYNTPPRDISRTITNPLAQQPQHNRTLLATPNHPNDKPIPLDQSYQPQPLPGHTPENVTYQPTPKKHAPSGPYITPPRARPSTNTTPERLPYHRPQNHAPYSPIIPPARTHSRTPIYSPRPQHNTSINFTNTTEIQTMIDRRFERFRQEMKDMITGILYPDHGSQSVGPPNPSTSGHCAP